MTKHLQNKVKTGRLFNRILKTFVLVICSLSMSLPVISSYAFINKSNGSDSLLSYTPNIHLKGSGDPKDFFDLFKNPKKNNTGQTDSLTQKGLGPYFAFLPAVGYAIASGYIGGLATCVSFFTDESKSKNSSILAGAYYTQNNQYWTIINTNVIVDKGKYNFVGDWRLYKFPTITYGLGSNSLLSEADHISYNYLKLYQVALEEIVPYLYAGIGYHLDFHFNIYELNAGTRETEFQQYGLTNQSYSSGVSLNLLYDNRANTINPSKGTYANIQIRQNCTFLGSNQNWNSLLIDAREYVTFPAMSKNVIALWSYNNFTFGNPPYLDLPSVGWDTYNNTGRGYAQGRFRGKDLVYLESEYRFTLTRNGLLGGVIFANEETLTEWPSNNFGSLMPGYGFGIRLKLNKHSDTNLAIDYGFGKDGSRGFFFNLGEVF